MPKIHSRPSTQRVAVATRPSKSVQMYGVYARSDSNSILGETPLFFLTREERDEWMEAGALRMVSHNKACRLLLNLPPSVQQSSAMGPSVTHGCMAHKRFAEVCALAWQPGWTPVMAANAYADAGQARGAAL